MTLLAGVLAAMTATSAPALAAPAQLPAVKRTLEASVRGVDTTTYRAPMSGFVTGRTAASDRSDWDLVLRDADSGRRLDSSSGFGSHEVAQTYAQAGQRVAVQARRRSGAARALRVSVVLADVAPPKSDGVPQLVSVKFRDNEDLQRIEEAGLDLTHHIHHGEADVIVTGAKQLAALKALRLPFEVEIADMNRHYAESRAADLRYGRRVGRSPLPSGRTDYRVLADYQTELKQLAEEHPDIVKPVVLPHKTFQGREIMGVEIANDVHAQDGRPVYFLHGMHHAREWPSAEAVMEFAHLLVEGRKSHRIKRLLETTRMSIVPIINVDGFVESREGGALGLPDPADETGFGDLQTVEGVVLLGGSFAYRRKNCNGGIPSGNVPCTLQYGVDNNRNYGNGWGGDGAGTDPMTQSYRGTGPFSEPETKAVWEYSRTRQVTNLITMHNVAALVLRPPGLAKEGKAPDEPRMKELGDAMAEAAGYTSQYGWELYDTSGTTEDWNYGAAGTFGYTMELGPASSDGGNFHISYDRGVVEQWVGPGERKGRGVRRALLRVIEEAATRQDHSTLVGRAAAGRILRLKKEFKTATSPICTIASPSDVRPNLPFDDPSACVAPSDPEEFDDGLEYVTRVPANNVFSWIVTPSTRPFVHKAGGRESWRLTCEDDNGVVYETRDVTIWRGEVQSFEMPCGGTLPTSGPGSVTPTSFEEAQSLSLVDRLAPTTTISRRHLKFSRRRIVLGGGSRDAAPEGLVPRVAQVRVTIARRAGRRCRFLDDQGRFGKRTSCSSAPYVVARVRRPAGTVRWNYAIGARLRKGRYFAFVRGLDANGNLETARQRGRNLVNFRIR
jgi:hypothetical protein